MKKTKIILFSLLLSFLVLSLAVYLANYILLQKPFHNVINSDSRNDGINFTIHYGYYIYPSDLVIDVKKIDGDKSALDVFRVFLQYSKEINSRTFNEIKLSSKGKTKFILTGKYFKTLGEEYGIQNPAYTIRTFPENLYRPDGQQAFESWTGGWIGVLGKQMNDANEFHKQWYIEDMDI
jgi:hypothetical protein